MLSAQPKEKESKKDLPQEEAAAITEVKPLIDAATQVNTWLQVLDPLILPHVVLEWVNNDNGQTVSSTRGVLENSVKLLPNEVLQFSSFCFPCIDVARNCSSVDTRCWPHVWRPLPCMVVVSFCAWLPRVLFKHSNPKQRRASLNSQDYISPTMKKLFCGLSAQRSAVLLGFVFNGVRLQKCAEQRCRAPLSG